MSNYRIIIRGSSRILKLNRRYVATRKWACKRLRKTGETRVHVSKGMETAEAVKKKRGLKVSDRGHVNGIFVRVTSQVGGVIDRIN